MNQMARTASKIIQPNEDVGMNGQMGLPQTWCAISQKECISQAMPMTRYDRKPTNANGVAMAGYNNSQTPNPPPQCCASISLPSSGPAQWHTVAHFHDLQQASIPSRPSMKEDEIKLKVLKKK